MEVDSSAAASAAQEDEEAKNRERMLRQQNIQSHRRKWLNKQRRTGLADVVGSTDLAPRPPGVPFDPRLVAVPYAVDELTRFDELFHPHAEHAHQWQLHAEPDLGVPLGLLDADAVEPLLSSAGRKRGRGGVALDRTDVFITGEEFHKVSEERPVTSGRAHNLGVTEQKRAMEKELKSFDWIKPGAVFQGDIYEKVNRGGGDARLVSARHLASTAMKVKEKGARMSRVGRANASFGGAAAAVNAAALKDEGIDARQLAEAVSGQVRHPIKKGGVRKPVRVWRVLPDAEANADEFVSVALDESPDDKVWRRVRGLEELAPEARRRRLSSATVRLFQAQDGSKPAWVYLPESQNELRRARDYSATVSVEDPTTETLVMRWSDTTATCSYALLSAQASLSKAPPLPAPGRSTTTAAADLWRQPGTSLVLHRRPWSEDETAARDAVTIPLTHRDPATELARRDRERAQERIQRIRERQDRQDQQDQPQQPPQQPQSPQHPPSPQPQPQTNTDVPQRIDIDALFDDEEDD